eukprot:7047105-Alexandrium_andersonii.AAC.1
MARPRSTGGPGWGCGGAGPAGWRHAQRRTCSASVESSPPTDASSWPTRAAARPADAAVAEAPA